MSFDYSGVRATAATLIDRFGKDAVLRREAGEVFDPVTGAFTAGTPVDTPVRVLETQPDQSYTAVNQVETGDALYLLDSSVSPVMSDRLVVGGVPRDIVALTVIQPGPDTVITKVQVRG